MKLCRHRLAAPQETYPPGKAGDAMLARWMAAPTGVICYHRGELAADRAFITGLHARAQLLMALAEQGRILLVQRRERECRTAYLAIASKRRPAR
ncbi:MAG: hypothetical protein Alpg2KO_01250 [Alphaproteobacteria bacterium]